MKSLVKAALLGLLLFGSAHAVTVDQVKTFTLENGMKIMVIEDNSIPNANMYLFWKAGSRNEAPGITGLSHFFEHMMFNGSKNYGPKMFDRTMEAAGGANNAYTTPDLTVYTNWFPAEAMETIFKLEADRIQYLEIDPEVVESERGVVTSERSTGLENSNFRALYYQVMGTAFLAHPYSWPVIGHESDIAAWSLQDLKDFHKTYYAPNNAVVVIAGAVTEAQVRELAKKYFEPIPAQAPPKEVRTVEPLQQGERSVYVHKPSVSLPWVMLAYHVPATKHKDFYALDLLQTILTQGNSSRLHQGIVEKQTAVQVDGYLPNSLDPSVYSLIGIAAPGVEPTALRDAMISEVNRVSAQGVTTEELEKAKNMKLMEFYQAMSTINGKSNTVGSYELYFGDYKKLFEAPERYSEVTIEDIQRVAQVYLKKSNRTVGILSSKEDKD
ncbi:M16 family metallopeptidase [Paraferrimonas sedimenticola]|uniref:Peptidase M16 n=1 Tax=Paraferrimonas sedimenticola TaxID=375674 RepID=A0AA37RYW3_9GAMM|nr:pitrilysin family protein [Paraferrimonas sedimenticola]GLP97833.1 peptidase M16 [Paraferrimonas sedimenticola]